MNEPFNKFGGISAILVGILSILYAIFFLLIARSAPAVGSFGSWGILAASGIFSSAAYVAIYQRLKPVSEGFSLWALLLGLAASFATLQHGGYQALLAGQAVEITGPLPSQVDPAGVATFFIVGIVFLINSWLILRSTRLPRSLGYLGLFNAALLIILYFATAGSLQTLILISGGLTSVIAGPVWWIWFGSILLR